MTDSASTSTSSSKRQRTGKDEFDTSSEFFDLLIRTKAEDFTIEGDPSKAPIFMAQRTDSISDIWQGLVRHNFLSVPIVLKEKEDRRYFGFVDMFDIAKYVVHHFGPEHKSAAAEEEKKEEGKVDEKASEKKMEKQKDFFQLLTEMDEFNNRTANDLMTWPLSRQNPFHPIHVGYSAFAVVEALAREPSLHRLPILDYQNHIVNLVTQSQVVNFVYQNIDLLGAKADKPLSSVRGLFKSVVTVRLDDIAMQAFSKMIDHNVSGIAVVDDDGHLVDTLSLRDLKLVGQDMRLFFRLQQSVRNYTRKLRAEYQDLHRRPSEVVSAEKTHTVGEVTKMLSEKHIHRVFIVDDKNIPIGVVSLKDLLLEIIS